MISFETDCSCVKSNGDGAKTIIRYKTDGHVVQSGYGRYGYVRQGGYQKGSDFVVAKLDGILSYAEQDEWKELLSGMTLSELLNFCK